MKTESEPKHTPLEVIHEPDKWDSAHDDLRIVRPLVDHPQGTHLTIAEMNVGAFAPHLDEPIAMAHLFSASPDLLAALKQCLPFVERIHAQSSDGALTLAAARAAIAKAEGGQP